MEILIFTVILCALRQKFILKKYLVIMFSIVLITILWEGGVVVPPLAGSLWCGGGGDLTTLLLHFYPLTSHSGCLLYIASYV